MGKPLTIGLIAQGGKNWIGGAELTKNLVLATSAYCRLAGIAVRFRLFSAGEISPSVTAEFEAVDDLQWITLPARKYARSLPGRAWQYLFPREIDGEWRPALKEHRIDFLYPKATIPKGSNCRSAAWIYDFQHKHLPEFFDEREIAARDTCFSGVARDAASVVLSSRTAEADFHRYFPGAAHKTRVLPFRVHIPRAWLNQDSAEIRLKYHLPEKFLIVCNQFWAHKNHALVLEALRLLKQELPNLLVAMTGHLQDSRDPFHCDRILTSIHTGGLHGHLRLLGLIPKQDQIHLLRASIAVIQPSLFEGWSTIVEEARALGKTILLSDLPVHREQEPPYAHFFDPRSASELARQLKDVWAMVPPNQDYATEERLAQSAYSERYIGFGKAFFELASHAEQG